MSSTLEQRPPAIPNADLRQRDAIDWARVERSALLAAAAGVIAYVVIGIILYFTGGLTAPTQYFLSYLVAVIYWSGIAIGSMALLMIQYLSGGAWGVVMRRVFEAAARTMPLILLFFVPLFIGLFLGDGSLYKWARPSEMSGPHSEDLRWKQPFLNPAVYIVFTVFFLAVYWLMTFFLTRWSVQQDESPSPHFQNRFGNLSAGGIVVYMFTMTFASIHWGMSLDPYWYSTMYPVLFGIGQLLNAFAFAVTVVLMLAWRTPLAEVINRSHRRDFGNLLETFIMLWAYMSVCQFILIWVENIPEESIWYVTRSYTWWKACIVLIFLFNFLVPFVLLLSRDVKQNPRTLRWMAMLLLAMRFVDIFWWVEPSLDHAGQYAYWLLDLAALVGLGGVWVWCFTRLLKQHPLLPIHDPYLPEALAHEHAE